MATKSNAAGTVFETVDPIMMAGRSSVWPQESHGGYRYAGFTGLLTGLLANTEIFQFRWTDASNLAVLKFLKVRYQVVTGFTAAQELSFDALNATAWTAAGSAGSQILPSGANLMKRTTFPISKVNEMRISTTSALGAGTKTLNAQAFMASMGKTLAAAATVQDAAFEETLDLTNSGDDPYFFLQNEGFAVRNSIAMGAGGTVRAAIQVAWAEFPNADYPTL